MSQKIPAAHPRRAKQSFLTKLLEEFSRVKVGKKTKEKLNLKKKTRMYGQELKHVSVTC